ncbi:CoA pyrophosphatase [Rhizobium sp. 16-449-1b]|uniref:NUDIX hydrolase n=1 Tax=Rhizobium sp. 16-449-1b TaxID=2819989 RepID=UPI001ADBDE6A|nr:CoA pyrophosphatase [Rhizobium sp. 16-449-1b]MBO9195402.1 CoA pyrophosphatase [Rhizobium sp. 16-449-1b]
MDQDIGAGEMFDVARIRSAVAAIAECFPPFQQGGVAPRAGICILLSGARDPEIALIERAPNLRMHASQWGLPGGKVDRDETVMQAALRELQEELGVILSETSVLGQLDTYLTPSGFLMCPFVCVDPKNQTLVPNLIEVASAFTLRVSELVDPDRFETFEMSHTRRISIRMKVNGGHLYAPAAAILFQFRELLCGRVTSVSQYEPPMFAWY